MSYNTNDPIIGGITEKIKEIPFFRGVDDKSIEELVNTGQIWRSLYKKGFTIHEQGTPCHTLDMVLSGKSVAYALAVNGSETVVFEFANGSIIGANLLFGNQNHYPMNIYCTKDSEIIHIKRSTVAELLMNYGFTMEFVKALSMNSQGLNKKIAMFTQKSLRENLMDYFVMLSAEQKSDTITLPISKKQLADYFSVQRPSLFRELKNMKDERLIDIDNRKITLLKD